MTATMVPRVEISESRQRWAKVFGVLLLLLNVADLIITFMVLGRGGVELNPLSAWLIKFHLIIPIKIGLCLWIAFSVMFLERSVTKLHYRVLIGVTAVYAIVVTWNCVMLALRHS